MIKQLNSIWSIVVFKDDRSHVFLPEDTQFFPLWPSHILKDFSGLWAFVWCGSTGWRAHLYPYIIIVLRSGSPQRTGAEPVSETDADRSVRLMPARAPVGPLTGVVSHQARHLLFSTSLLGRFAGEWSAHSWALAPCWPASMQSCQRSRVLDLARPGEVSH